MGCNFRGERSSMLRSVRGQLPGLSSGNVGSANGHVAAAGPHVASAATSVWPLPFPRVPSGRIVLKGKG